MRVYVIITTFNNARFIADCLDSLMYDNTPDKKIVVVDDCSTDGTVDIVRKISYSPWFWRVLSRKGKDLVLIESTRKAGFTGSNNVGMSYALLDKSTEYVVLLNSDTVVTPDWLNGMLKEMDEDPEVGIVGPKTLRFDKKTVDTAGHDFHYALGAADNRGSGELDHGQYDERKDVLSVQFSCALLRRSMIDQIGLLDWKMFFYNEDIDYCIRARIHGWKVLYSPSALIYHCGGGSGIKQRWRGYSNRLRTVLKDYEGLRWGLFGFLFCVIAILTAFAKRKDLNTVPYYAYAFLWNLVHLPIRERQEIQRTRKYDDSVISRYNIGGDKWWY